MLQKKRVNCLNEYFNTIQNMSSVTHLKRIILVTAHFRTCCRLREHSKLSTNSDYTSLFVTSQISTRKCTADKFISHAHSEKGKYYMMSYIYFSLVHYSNCAAMMSFFNRKVDIVKHRLV